MITITPEQKLQFQIQEIYEYTTKALQTIEKNSLNAEQAKEQLLIIKKILEQ